LQNNGKRSCAFSGTAGVNIQPGADSANDKEYSVSPQKSIRRGKGMVEALTAVQFTSAGPKAASLERPFPRNSPGILVFYKEKHYITARKMP
jgi:hypothetical protein